MTDTDFMRAAELKQMDRAGTFILGVVVGFCVGISALTLTLLSL